MVAVARHSRCPICRRPQAQGSETDDSQTDEKTLGETEPHPRMLPSPFVRRELLRDAALYLAATLILGALANLAPGRHLGWWGQGKQPPTEGLDFAFIDPLSAETLRLSLPTVVFLDTRSGAEMEAAHVPGAVAFDYTAVNDSLSAELERRLRASDAVVIYGSSSETDIEQLTAQELRLRGLAPPYVMTGGFGSWEASGLPVEPEEALP